MDWGYKAALTTMTVAAVLMTAQIFSRRLAGMVAGLPVISAPALLWIAAEEGAAFAASSAIGSVAACGAAAVFALIYERAARRCGVVVSMAAALAGGGVAALALASATRGANGLAVALATSATLCALALLQLPAAEAKPPAGARLRNELWLTAVSAGAISAAVAAGSQTLGAFWSGLLSSMPIISSAALVHLHRTGQHADRQRFLRGYASGLVGKAAFATVFAAAAVQMGSAMAMALALAAAVAVSLGLIGRLRPAPEVGTNGAAAPGDS